MRQVRCRRWQMQFLQSRHARGQRANGRRRTPSFAVEINPETPAAFHAVRRIRNQNLAVKSQGMWRKRREHRRLDIGSVQWLGLNLSHLTLDADARRGAFYQQQVAATAGDQYPEPMIEPRRRGRLYRPSFPAVIQLPYQSVQFPRLIHSCLPLLDVEEGSLAHSYGKVQHRHQGGVQCRGRMSADKASGGKKFTTRPGAGGPCAMRMRALLLREFMVINRAGAFRELTLSDEQLRNELSRVFLDCLGVKPG